MTTKHSPLRELRAQADKIAAMLKAAERNELPIEQVKAARSKDVFKIGIFMDDKLISLDIPWLRIENSSEAALSAYILRLMREDKDTIQ